jgi:deazaflavin-dependent oxidoreductase (nitroreductase family)
MESPPASEPFCYITTAGRVTGRPHEIEIWFGMNGSTIYMLSGGGQRSDWVRNIVTMPKVAVRIGDRELRVADASLAIRRRTPWPAGCSWTSTRLRTRAT